jgi:acyl-CoA synthetase (AMP-forming)/AMP-acid ligase II
VVARPDVRLGQVPVAFVVAARAGRISADDVLAIAAAELAPYKVPVAVVLVDDLPRNTMGKILRTELRDRAAALDLPALHLRSQGPTAGTVGR